MDTANGHLKSNALENSIYDKLIKNKCQLTDSSTLKIMLKMYIEGVNPKVLKANENICRHVLNTGDATDKRLTIVRTYHLINNEYTPLCNNMPHSPFCDEFHKMEPIDYRIVLCKDNIAKYVDLTSCTVIESKILYFSQICSTIILLLEYIKLSFYNNNMLIPRLIDARKLSHLFIIKEVLMAAGLPFIKNFMRLDYLINRLIFLANVSRLPSYIGMINSMKEKRLHINLL